MVISTVMIMLAMFILYSHLCVVDVRVDLEVLEGEETIETEIGRTDHDHREKINPEIAKIRKMKKSMVTLKKCKLSPIILVSVQLSVYWIRSSLIHFACIGVAPPLLFEPLLLEGEHSYAGKMDQT